MRALLRWTAILFAIFAMHGCVGFLTAHADEVMTIQCEPGFCEVRQQVPGAEARIIHVPPSPDNDARVREWLAFCKPNVRVDSLGVERLEYAHPQCSHGVTR